MNTFLLNATNEVISPLGKHQFSSKFYLCPSGPSISAPCKSTLESKHSASSGKNNSVKQEPILKIQRPSWKFGSTIN